MNRTGIEKALRYAVNSAPQLSFEQLTAMPYVKMQEHDYITKQDPVKSTGHARQYSFAAAFCLALLVLLSGWYFTNRVSSVITLDVNPSIEIRANLSDRVLSVRAINEDAAVILTDNDYKGKRLGEVVPLIMNTLVEHQYLNTEHNAILLTVTNKNNRKADDLRSKVDAVIRESLMSYNIAPTIMSQKLSKETERTKLAGQYGLSEGKLSLIQDLIAANPSFTIDSLAGKSVSQLYNLAKGNSVDLNKYFINEKDKDSYINPGKSEEDADEVQTPDNSNTQNGSDTENNDTEKENEIGNTDENDNQDIEEQDQQGDNEDNDKESKGEDNQDYKSGNNEKRHKSKNGSVPTGNINEGSGKEDNQDTDETQISGQGDEGSNGDSQISEDSGEDGDQQEDAGSGASLNEKDNEDQEDGDGNYDIGNGGNSDSENNYDSLNSEDGSSTLSDQDNQGSNGDYQDGGSSDEDNQENQNED